MKEDRPRADISETLRAWNPRRPFAEPGNEPRETREPVPTQQLERLRDRAVKLGLPASRAHYGAILAGRAQVTIRQWFRLPLTERQRRVAAFKTADAALQEYRPPGRQEDERYHELNGRVNDLWPTVPWWCRR